MRGEASCPARARLGRHAHEVEATISRILGYLARDFPDAECRAAMAELLANAAADIEPDCDMAPAAPHSRQPPKAMPLMPRDPAAAMETAGKALFGPNWEGPLSQELGVNDRTMRRWMADPSSIPVGVWGDIVAVCRRRAETLNNLAASMGADFPSQVGQPLAPFPRR